MISRPLSITIVVIFPCISEYIWVLLVGALGFLDGIETEQLSPLADFALEGHADLLGDVDRDAIVGRDE